MANHVRQQLREAVATAVTGLSTTGSRVYQSRVYPLDTSSLPCLLVTSDGDKAEAITVHSPYQQERATTIRIEGVAKAVSNIDDTLDTISKEVETAIAGSSTAIVKGLIYQGAQIDYDGSGEQPIGKVTMIFTKDLYTLSNAPDVLI